MTTKNADYNVIPWRDGDWIDVTKEANKYRFLEDALYGTGGYRTGKYLVPHKRENANDLSIRKSKAYYSNQYRPIWQAHHKPIYKDQAVRVINEDLPLGAKALYDVFIENCDGKGTSFQEFSQDNAGITKNKGASFMVMNNSTEIDATIEDVINERTGVPYTFKITPDMVYDYKADSFGNLIELRWAQQDGEVTYNNLGQATDLSNVNADMPSIVVGVNAEYWTIYNDDGTEVTEQFENTIGVIPVVRLVEEDTDEIIPEPSLYSVARIGHRVYNLGSIITDIADNQAFSILTMPQRADSSIEFSTNKGLSYDGESSNKPEFISPDAQQLKTLLELQASLINEQYQAGVVSHLQRFQQSAESKEVDRARLNDLLGTFKNQIEQAERKLMYLFGLYTGYEYDYNVFYSDDFGISTLSERIDQFMQLASTDKISDLTLSELEKGLVGELLDFASSELKDEFMAKLETNLELKQNQSTIENQFLIEE